MNAHCVLDTSLGRIFLRRLAMVLEIILYITLQRLMGQNSFGVEGDSILGIRAMKVWFIFGGMFLKFKTNRVASITSKPTIFQ